MRIRKATLQDLNELAEIEKICFPPNQAASYESIQKRLQVFSDHFWILEEDSIISFIDGLSTDQKDLTDEMYEHPEMHDPDGAWQMIFGVNTLPLYRRRGYAGKLIQTVIEESRQKKKKGVVLTCLEEKIHYYASFGFINEGISDSIHGGDTWYQMRITF
ncbi:MAG: GNAT family N-acetyltransferase [Solobacterium sp.]|nr:GNAT family N-acetyltransferase [Solobacterium sp.]